MDNELLIDIAKVTRQLRETAERLDRIVRYELAGVEEPLDEVDDPADELLERLEREIDWDDDVVWPD